MAFNFFNNSKKPGQGSTTTTTKTSSAPKVVVTKTTVSVPVPIVRHRVNPPPTSHDSASPSSHSKRKLEPSSASSSARSKARPSDSPPKPKARKLAPEKKRSQGTPVHRALAAEDSSSEDDDRPQNGVPPAGSRAVKTSYNMGGPDRLKSEKSSRSGTPMGGYGGAGEVVVERDVRAQPGASSRGIIHSENVVNADKQAYRIFFTGEGSDDHEQPARITLQYPVKGASERFVLLCPKISSGEYDPVMEVARIIRTVLENYLPPPASLSAAPSPLPSSAPSPTPISFQPSPSPLGPLSTPLPPAPLVLPPTSPLPPLTHSSHHPDDISTESARIIRLLTRSTASNILSLPMFLEAVTRYNALIFRSLESGEINETVKNMRGLKTELWGLIGEQVYQRVVGPKMDDLVHYRPFSDNVYGELTPKFVSLIAAQTHLSPTSTFVDLGSGVGNCVLQLALQVGCASYGCEQLSGPAKLARAQLKEAKRRWALWGLKGAPEAEVWEGDFCESPEVARVLTQADVVICNNYAFSSELNEKLSLLFLDLKAGAQIISLRPFVSPDFRLTERTCSSPQAILSIEQHRFTTQAVSWTHEGGVYYIQTVDRRMVQKFFAKKNEENGNGAA